MNITEDYVSFETAKLLKEKSYKGSFNGYYNNAGYIVDKPNTLLKEPKYQYYERVSLYMAMKWLREQNRIISIVHGYITNKYRIIITQSNELDITNLGNTLYCSNDYDYFSYEEAVEAAIKYCLTNLIK